MMKPMNRGFTLIEMMVIVVIIAILSAIALPSYQEHVRRSNRAEGQAFLSDAAARQERFYAQGNTYATSLSELYNESSRFSTTDKYSLGISVVADDGGYTLTATPQFSDAKCGNLTLNAKGDRGATDVDYCWR